MSSLNDLPSDMNREKLIRVLKKLGFTLDKRGGNGSHYKVICPNQKVIILPHKLYKQILKVILKEIEKNCGITWEQIKKEL